jgi:hypothetical protein
MLDSTFNNEQPIKQNPKKDWLGLGGNVSGPLQVQVATNQF